MPEMIELELGALAPKISSQMKRQGFRINGKDLFQLQQDANAIVRLHIRGLLNDSETQRSRNRLFAKVKKAIKL